MPWPTLRTWRRRKYVPHTPPLIRPLFSPRFASSFARPNAPLYCDTLLNLRALLTDPGLFFALTGSLRTGSLVGGRFEEKPQRYESLHAEHDLLVDV